MPLPGVPFLLAAKSAAMPLGLFAPRCVRGMPTITIFVKGSGALRWVHTLISNLKAFLQGTYHGLGKKHLQGYFDEFCFRFNRRFWPNLLFPRLVCAVAASNILGHDDLTR